MDVCLDARCLVQGHAKGRSTFDANEVDPCASLAGYDDPEYEEQEMTGGDVEDAYPHLAVHPDELEACLSWPASPTQADILLLWTNLFFGLRSAPLVWCRFAAALMRILQLVYDPHRARDQVYIDDIMWMFNGCWRRRSAMITLFCFLCSIFCVRLSWIQTVRGTVLT